MSAANFTDMSTVPEGTSEVAAMVIAIVQTGFFLVFGPTVLFYGPAVHKTVLFVQALFAANYIAFAGAVAAVDAFTAFDVWDKFVVMATATLTLTFTAIKSVKARALSQGAVLGVLIATPLTEFMRNLLFVQVVGCTGFGEKTPIFPDGVPTGCDLNSVEFQASFQCSKLVFWIITAAMAAVGKKVFNISVAMTGATMLMKGLVDLIKRISIIVMPEYATDIVALVTPIRAFVGYGLAAVGVLVQIQILNKTHFEVDGKPVDLYVLKPPAEIKVKVFRCFVSPFIRCMLIPLQKFSKFLTIKMEGKGFVPPSIDNLTAAAEKKAEAAKEKAIQSVKDKAKKEVDKASKAVTDKVKSTTGVDIGDATKAMTDDLKSAASSAVTDVQVTLTGDDGKAKSDVEA